MRSQRLLQGWHNVIYLKQYFGWPDQPSSGLDVTVISQGLWDAYLKISSSKAIASSRKKGKTKLTWTDRDTDVFDVVVFDPQYRGSNHTVSEWATVLGRLALKKKFKKHRRRNFRHLFFVSKATSAPILFLVSRQASSTQHQNTRRVTRVTQRLTYIKTKYSSKFVFGFILYTLYDLYFIRIIRLTDNPS